MNGFSQIKKRVVFIDDSQVTSVLKYILESTGRFKIVGVFSSYEELLPSLKRNLPDILISEIDIPGAIGGLEGIRQVLAINSGIKVLVCSEVVSMEVVTEAFAIGANGYVLKNESFNKFQSYVDELANGGSPLSPSISKLIIESYRKSSHSPLSARETEVIKLLAKGMTHREIAVALQISYETSKVHIKNIYRKLHVEKKSQAIELVVAERYI
jgi:DNA-binding NarL/FixJ family response regulator